MRLAFLNPLVCYSLRSSRSHFLQKPQIRRMASTTTTPNAEGGGATCIPCSTMDLSFLLTPEEVQNRLDASYPLWKLVTDTATGPSIRRRFTTKHFQAALDCLNAMGAVAERENHHPDFHLTNYRDVEVAMWTHKLSGITESDLTVAAMLDKEVRIDYSPKWLQEHPEAKIVNA